MTAKINTGNYKHTQRGIIILAVTLVLMALFAVLALTLLKPMWIPALILLVTGWLFHSLTIEIAGRELRWRFGSGLIHRSVSLNEIISAEPVRTGPSWGIHWSPRTGWLYNVSGFDAVLVTLRGGKKLAVGTDEPEALAAAIRQQIS